MLTPDAPTGSCQRARFGFQPDTPVQGVATLLCALAWSNELVKVDPHCIRERLGEIGERRGQGYEAWMTERERRRMDTHLQWSLAWVIQALECLDDGGLLARRCGHGGGVQGWVREHTPRFAPLEQWPPEASVNSRAAARLDTPERRHLGQAQEPVDRSLKRLHQEFRMQKRMTTD